MDDVAKVQMLVDMGLSPTDAMEAVAREKMSQVLLSFSIWWSKVGSDAPNPGMGPMVV
jgi:hypothetical protein